jgi:peptidoglycan-associated lipoprotein
MENQKLAGSIILAAVCLCACVGPARRKTAAGGPGAKNGASAPSPEAAGSGDVQEASLRAHVYESDPQLQTVHFALDSTDFSDETLSLLKANAAYLKTRGSDAVLIEGYADDRGTIEYNLALGQRRAEAIEKYYRELGVPLRRMATISYGKLKPICSQDDEKCWGQNRRGETKLGTPVE